MDSGVVAVEAELVPALFNAGVEGAVVAPERYREHKLVLRRIPEKKTALGFVLQERLRLVPAWKHASSRMSRVKNDRAMAQLIIPEYASFTDLI